MVESTRKEDQKLLFINRQWTKEEEELFGKYLKTPKKDKKGLTAKTETETPVKKKVGPAYK